MCRFLAYRGEPIFLTDLVCAPSHSLVHQSLHAAEAKTDAERIFVGKTPGQTHSRQLISDALLVSKASEGKSVEIDVRRNAADIPNLSADYVRLADGWSCGSTLTQEARRIAARFQP